MQSRRAFLAAVAGSLATARPTLGTQTRPRRIVLRSSWQTINIGDIAHTPGVLRLLEQHLPDAEVTLWASTLDGPVRQLLGTRFPRVRVIELAEHADPVGTPLEAVVRDADLLIHGSGPMVLAPAALRLARTHGKPYGVYGVTLDTLDASMQELIGGAAFVFTRETASLEYLRSLSLRTPAQAFTPDGTFALDIRDDATADAFRREHGLEAKRYLCVVPRLRYTPYPRIVEGAARGEPDAVRRLKINDEFVATDHARLRDVIVAWVRGRHGKVLACPEMTYQVPLLRPLLFDPLPDDVKPAVVVRDRYWRTDQAASTYAQAALVVSFEMHSPIIAVANGTPAIHVRQPTDTRKGQMWRDVGLSDWIFEVDATPGDVIAKRALEIAADPRGAAALVEKAMVRVRERHRDTMRTVADAAGARFVP